MFLARNRNSLSLLSGSTLLPFPPVYRRCRLGTSLDPSSRCMCLTRTLHSAVHSSPDSGLALLVLLMVCRAFGCDSVAVAFWLLPLPCPSYYDRCAPDRVLPQAFVFNSRVVAHCHLLVGSGFGVCITNDCLSSTRSRNDTHKMTDDSDDCIMIATMLYYVVSSLHSGENNRPK